ncbi:PepSY-like domain-containing protein [Sphingobacterium psychroaquaticum]|uniref:Putative beta-lactamase-inhibitor-like, PepSY-like n=1 Tax=Sphingobacterium psychroaquaticum TaxID=561061 RepID=A0A1X7KT20_9SPHI|nr:PepSY-like domain-containing protein [Sphingobacterium psychroaquaticum]QBQ40597.1 hypothetical protein E2P86_05295 [Sphingobacterium psychroaquaticum]SMG43970.1 Putative beta-lactamase-inhibitor-like, PepSY-like [Sphingobacterium psychroaquaticum]
MKKLSQILTAVLIVFTVAVASAHSYDRGKVIPFSQLPAKAQTFFKAHFSQTDISSVMLFTEYVVKKEYSIYLKDGSKVEFDGNGEWDAVKMKGKSVPNKIIPANIVQHVHKSFPNTYIKEIKKSRNKYELEISNGLELEFNLKGEFLRIDD